MQAIRIQPPALLDPRPSLQRAAMPFISPTRARVEAMLAWADRPASECLVPHCFPSGLPLTVGTLAVNAVMAGCRPEYFPILLTAALAVAEPRYRLMQAMITSHPAGNAIIVSGPLANEIGLASGGGCLALRDGRPARHIHDFCHPS